MNNVHRISILAFACALAFPTLAEPGEEPAGEVNAAAIAQAVDSMFEMTLGGRLHTDLSFPLERSPFDGRFGDLESGLEARRARLFVQGRMHDRIDFKVEVDFAGGEVSAKDLYFGVRGLPVGTRFGHFKEPFSLEELTSSRYTTFMERSLINALAPSRNTGVRVDGGFGEERGTWAVGVFRDSDGFAADPGDNYGLSGRVTWAPILEGEGARLLHLGVSASHRWIDGAYRLGVRPGDHLAMRLLRVSVEAESADLVQLEGAANFGPLGLQAEWATAAVGSVDGTDPRFHGFYIQAGYFLTGEHRPYDGGDFGRLVPRADLGEGSGAWEIAVRYARLDTTDASPTGGEMWNATLGVNWYWYPQFRWMLNFERAGLPGIAGDDFGSVHLRASFDF